jgi:DNA mismatch endonuclease (patch repair protein)
MVVRRLVHSLGYRYRLHVNALPGNPDLAFATRRRVIFIHGCFWHRHICSLGDRIPKSRLDFWVPKLEGNRLRDARKLRALRKAGWKALVIWECQLRDLDKVRRRIESFLGLASCRAHP